MTHSASFCQESIPVASVSTPSIFGKISYRISPNSVSLELHAEVAPSSFFRHFLSWLQIRAPSSLLELDLLHNTFYSSFMRTYTADDLDLAQQIDDICRSRGYVQSPKAFRRTLVVWGDEDDESDGDLG